MASYPNNIFATGSYRPTTNEPLIINKHWDSIANEIPAIESELGTNPSGYASDVKTRLNDINPTEGNLDLNAGFGSKAPIYGVRAWVKFSGTTISQSANVSSVTSTSTGIYDVNFTSAMPDGNYAAVTTGEAGGGSGNKGPYAQNYFTGYVRLYSYNGTGGFTALSNTSVIIVR